MFQIETGIFQNETPFLTHSFDLQRASYLVIQFPGFLGQALCGKSAGGHENMGVNISRIMALLRRV